MYNDDGYTFGGYDRVFEMLSGGFNAAFDLKKNKCHIYSSHAHFLPVWWHDGTYTPTVYIFDCWSPGGMLCVQNTGTFNVHGSVFDDYHSGPIK